MVETVIESATEEVVAKSNGRSGKDNSLEYNDKKSTTLLQNGNQSALQEFYAGENIFVTGGTGFMGKLLVEKLLRSCPGIGTIYLLIRQKKGKDVHQRTNEMFEDPVFDKLREAVPKFRHQIVPIAGDCCVPGLGLSPADRATLIKEVSILFHVAATVRFDEKLKLAVAINVKALLDVIKLAKEMPNLKSILHVSTAYANCVEEVIDEKFYAPPIEYKKLITMVDCMSDKVIEDLTPQLLGKWPNTYAYTKAVGEHVVNQEADDLPIGVFRPAIVISTYQEPIRGWIDNMYGPTGVAAGAGSGLLRTLHCNGSFEANVVPGDLTINALIVSAWDVYNIRGKDRNAEIPIYNYTSMDNPITWDGLKELSEKYGMDFPTSKMIWYYSFRNNKHKYIHLLYVYFLHLFPALIIDSVTFCIGKQPRLLKLYKKIHKFMEVLNYFTTQEWRFANGRVTAMLEKLSPKDRENFVFDMKDLVWDTFFQTYLQGIRLYLIKDPVETLPAARAKYQKLYWLHQAVRLIFAYVFLRIAWAVVATIYAKIV